MAKIIILNAPPGAGKDTIANALYRKCDIVPVSFKRPMFQIAAAMLGNETYQLFINAYDDRERKEQPHDFLGGKTCREFMIWISETVIKPVFGDKHFGSLMSEHLKEYGAGKYICSDGGFPDEVESLIESGHEVVLIRMWRDGYNFDNDSRNYIYLHERFHGDSYREYDVNLTEGEPGKAVDAIEALLDFTYPEEPDEIPW